MPSTVLCEHIFSHISLSVSLLNGRFRLRNSSEEWYTLMLRSAHLLSHFVHKKTTTILNVVPAICVRFFNCLLIKRCLKTLQYNILLLFFRILTDDRFGHRSRTVNCPKLNHVKNSSTPTRRTVWLTCNAVNHKITNIKYRRFLHRFAQSNLKQIKWFKYNYNEPS